MQSHFQQIRSKYKTEERTDKKGKVKNYLIGPDQLVLSEGRLQKVISKAFESFKESGIEEAQVTIKPKGENPHKQFCVKKMNGALCINTPFKMIAEGAFGVVHRSYDISEAKALVMKRVKFSEEVSKESKAEEAVVQLTNEVNILNLVGGEYGIIPKPLKTLTLLPPSYP